MVGLYLSERRDASLDDGPTSETCAQTRVHSVTHTVTSMVIRHLTPLQRLLICACKVLFGGFAT